MVTTLKPRVGTLDPRRTADTVNASSWRSGKTSTQRGYGSRWQRARAWFLREHPLCAYCERKGLVTAASVVDHIEPHAGDERLFWDEANWQPLCKPCHDSTKRLEELGGGREKSPKESTA